jgi:phage recombination protein Bet
MAETKEKELIAQVKTVAADIVARPQTAPIVWELQLSPAERTFVSKDLNEDEALMFFRVCNHMQLDPVAKQLIPVKYRDNDSGGYTLSFITTIESYRLIADRSGLYQGTTPPTLFVALKDNNTKTVPHSEYNPEEHTIISATIGVRAKGDVEPVFATAIFKHYNSGNKMWRKFPDVMIIKCAEAAVLKRRFPRDFSTKVYIKEEMDQAGVIYVQDSERTPLPPKPERRALTPEVVGDTGASPLQGLHINFDKRLAAIKCPDHIRDKVVAALFEAANITSWDDPVETAQVALITEWITKKSVPTAKKLMEEL